MKIKSDFITNSSSTAYIVAIPNDFEPDQEVILKYFETHNIGSYGSEEWSQTRILEDFSECLDILKKGDNIWNYGDEGADPRIFYTVADICEENDFTLSIMDLSNEGNTRIEGIPEEVVSKWFMNTLLQKSKIEVPDE